MRGFTFLLLLSIAMLGTWGCGSDTYLTHQVTVETEVYPDLWVDSFIQPAQTDGYDILWVIDRSGSMGNHDAQLLLGIEEMLTSLPLDTGWRLGIISTDPDEALSNTTFPLVPGDDITDAMAALNMLGTGWGAAPGEMGFEAVYTYMDLGAYSTTWMRPTAALLIVFVSDEDEQSLTWTSADFSNWVSGKRSRVFITSIVGLDESTCADQVGEQYLDVTRNFSGVEIDICEEDWTPGVEEARQPFDPIEEIELSFAPVVDTLSVFIDGVLTDQSEWEYNEQLNTVFFLVVPADGALVEVTYGIAS